MATQREDFTEATRWRRRPRPTFAWLAQVVSGVLRTYDQVVAWIRNPVVFTVEALLLVCVTWHAIAGVHGVLLDLGLRGRAERIVARLLGDLAVATILYGLWLLSMLALRG